MDEPEPEAVPLIGAPGTGVDADDTDVTTDRMSEEELLKGLEGLTPPEASPSRTPATKKNKPPRRSADGAGVNENLVLPGDACALVARCVACASCGADGAA